MNMKNTINIILTLVVIVLLFLLLIFFANTNKKDKEHKILDNGATTYATILYCGFKNDIGNFVSIEYFVDDKKYLDRTSAPNNQYQVNEQIEITYNSAEPTTFISHFYNMKLKDTIQSKLIEATIINIEPTKRKIGNQTISMLTYVYDINNIKYTRTNELLVNDANNYSIGQKIPIRYNIDNPKSSIF